MFTEGVGSIYYTYMYNKTGSCTAYLTICPEATEDCPFRSFKSWGKGISTLSKLIRLIHPQSYVQEARRDNTSKYGLSIAK